MQYEEIKEYIGRDLYFIDKEDERFPIKEGKVCEPDHGTARINLFYVKDFVPCYWGFSPDDVFSSFNEAKFEYFRRALCDENIGRVGCCVVDDIRLETDCFVRQIDSRANGTGFIDAGVTVNKLEILNRRSVLKESIENVFPTKEMAQEYIDKKYASFADNLVSITKKPIEKSQEWKKNVLEPINERTIKSLVYGDEIFLIDPSSLDRIAVFQCPILSDTLLAIKEKLSFAYWNLNAAQKTLEEIKRKKTLSDFKASTKRIFKEETDLLRNGDVYYYFNNLGEILSKTFCDSKGLDSLTDERILTIDGGYWTKNGAQLALIEAIRKGRIN